MTYSDPSNTVVFKIVYECPAGSFGGWFLHTVTTIDAEGSPDTYWSGFTVGERRLSLHDSVNSRLASMLGGAAVKWVAHGVHEVAPAAISVEFPV